MNLHQSMTNQITHLGAYRKIWPPDEWEPPDDGELPSRVPARDDVFHAFHGAETVIRTE